MAAVSIPVMAKVRIGHFVEAQILQAVGVDYIDVSRYSSDLPDRVSLFATPQLCFNCIAFENSEGEETS